ncbi:MAG TPA: hypothetical protein VGG61_14680 [Gemmataceae bacterium]
MARSTDWVPDDAWIEFGGWVGLGVLRAAEKSYDVTLRQSEWLFLGNAQVGFGVASRPPLLRDNGQVWAINQSSPRDALLR